MKKLLYVTPHLSTGGLPQYLLKKIEYFKNEFEIFVVEYSDLSPIYVVQKNKIKDIVPPEKFFTLGEDKFELLSIIDNCSPDIIHFEEIPETFIEKRIIRQLINKQDRDYFVVTTTHSSATDPSTLLSYPDKFVLVSEWSKQKFESVIDIPCDIWEYPIEDFTPEKDKYKTELGFNPNFKHVVNIGLFTPGKNQKEVFEIAQQLSDKPIKFHFIGNQAPNFETYWGPLMKDKPKNCIIWGERDDTYKFLQAADLFYFSSVLELNPLVVKESLSYKLPILMRNLPQYLDSYDKNTLVTYIDNNIENTKTTLLNKLGYDIR